MMPSEARRGRISRAALTNARRYEAEGDVERAVESYRVVVRYGYAEHSADAVEGLERLQLAAIRREQVDPVIEALGEVVPKIVRERVLRVPSVAEATALRLYQQLEVDERWRNAA